jgi:4-amino-4-deoxy-L-arabinose transferase-like glycosyltransferase
MEFKPELFKSTYTGSKGNRFGRFLYTKASILLVILLAGISLSRFVAIGNDPPWWMSPEFMCDEGWWADSARGVVFFNDYFADDFGTAYLVAPGYTLLLKTVYRLFGVGLVQSRMVSSVSSVLTIFLVAVLVWKKLGRVEALFCTVLLGASPFSWAYSRVALIETPQALCITAAFCLYLLKGQKPFGAFFSGLFTALAVALKPNAIIIGLLPLFVVAAVTTWFGGGPGDALAAKRKLLLFLRLIGWAFLGLASGFSFFIFWMVIPSWKQLVAMAVSESLIGKSSITRFLTLPGQSMMSVDSAFGTDIRQVWRLALWSPAIFTGAWLSFLRLTGKSVKASSVSLRNMSKFEVAVAVWMITTWLFISLAFTQPDRRFVILLPAMAIAATSLVFKHNRSEISLMHKKNSRIPVFKRIVCSSYFQWAALLLPLYIVIKRISTLAIMNATTHINLGMLPGISYQTASTLFVIVWFIMLIPISKLRSIGERFRLIFLSRIGVALLFILLVYEGITVVQMIGSGSNSFQKAQAVLNRLVAEDQTVLGHAAASTFLSHNVRTIRRTTSADETPPPNPDVWDRTTPKYIIELAVFNYQRAQYLYHDLIAQKGYSLLYRFNVCPVRRSGYKFALELYEQIEHF